MTRVALITDRYLKDSRMVKEVISSLPQGSEHIVVADIPEEPTYEEMSYSMKRIRDFQPDWFIGVGGGSSIDTSKVLFALYERPDLSVYDITPLVKLNLRKKSRLIAVPTTSGTGSECSWAAVVSEEDAISKEKRKNELASEEILPDIAILDPKMVVSLPAEQTRNTAADAITHAIEAYVSAWKNPFSDALAEKALELITSSLEGVLKNPEEQKLRGNVHIGASMAGLSFSNSQIGLAHALGHALGACFKIPHGKCVGFFLPYVVQFNYTYARERYDRLEKIFPENVREGSLDRTIERYFESIGQPVKFEQLSRSNNISRDEYIAKLERMVTLSSESTGLTLNPRDASRDDIRELLLRPLR